MRNTPFDLSPDSCLELIEKEIEYEYLSDINGSILSSPGEKPGYDSMNDIDRLNLG